MAPNFQSRPFRVAPPPRWHRSARILVGLSGGLAAGINALTGAPDPKSVRIGQIVLYLVLGLLFGGLAMWANVVLTRRLVQAANLSSDARTRYQRGDLWTDLLFLLPWFGAVGIVFVGPLIFLIAAVFVGLKAGRIYRLLDVSQQRRVFSSLGWLAFLFLVSGFAALIYQIVWERVLFAAFGVNIESITIVVSLFMFGLGLGSLAGGLVARRFPGRAPELFLVCETAIGIFGLVSIPLIKAVSRVTLYGSLLEVSLTIFCLLVLPTMLMGATLPILVGHLYRHYKNVGKSVGILYCINTVGSALACFITADVLFAIMGEQASVVVAALCNFTVGILVMRYARRLARERGTGLSSVEMLAEPVAVSEG